MRNDKFSTEEKIHLKAFYWLVQEWPYATLFAVPFLVLLLPICFFAFGLPMTLIIAQLPIYMLHQYEEHDKDRFRIFINQRIGKGKELLTPIAVFWINFAVWVTDLIALYLALYVNLSFGLIAIYLPLLNGLLHIAQGIKLRCYNPGLLTSIFLFLPIGGWSLYVIQDAFHPNLIYHATGLAVAILIHIFVFLHVVIRARKL